MSAHTLTQAQVAILFHLNGHLESEELTEGAGEELYLLARAAYAAVEPELRKLPSATRVTEEPDPMEVEAYEMCEFDGSPVAFHGKWVTGIWFSSTQAFSTQALSELKELCTQKFSQAAAARSASCAFAGIQAYNSYRYSEKVNLEVA